MRPSVPDITHVAYKGIGPAFADILGGQTQALFPGLAAAMPHIRSGKVRPLAVTGLKRHPLVPDVPTFEELASPKFDERAVVAASFFQLRISGAR